MIVISVSLFLGTVFLCCDGFNHPKLDHGLQYHRPFAEPLMFWVVCIWNRLPFCKYPRRWYAFRPHLSIEYRHLLRLCPSTPLCVVDLSYYRHQSSLLAWLCNQLSVSCYSLSRTSFLFVHYHRLFCSFLFIADTIRHIFCIILFSAPVALCRHSFLFLYGPLDPRTSGYAVFRYLLDAESLIFRQQSSRLAICWTHLHFSTDLYSLSFQSPRLERHYRRSM